MGILRNRITETFHVYSPSGVIDVVERIDSYVETASGDIVPHLPYYRLASSHVTVNWVNDESFSVVGSGEILRRVDSIKYPPPRC
jgi:hypothetical protein